MFCVESAADRVARISLRMRRARETERRDRMCNDKGRTTGVDKEALDEQRKEKEKRQDAAKEEKNAHDAAVRHHWRVATLLHGREQKERRAMEKATVDYRRQHQQPLELEEPGDARMMLPGLVGEEPDSESRRHRQKEQLREWLIQQQRERAAERHQQQLEGRLVRYSAHSRTRKTSPHLRCSSERRFDQSRGDMDAKALQLQSVEMERRKAALVASAEYNRATQGQHDHARAATHLRGKRTGEGAKPPEGAVAAPGWGSSSDRRQPPESLLETIRFQKYQIEEKRRAQEKEKRDEEQRDRVRLDSGRTALLLERRQAKVNKQLRRQLDSTNVQLAETHKQQNPDIKRGYIDDSFFSKFNTCSR
ncbi:RIB43A-like with coiled-coils protein 2 isoform 3-T3 [Spinachia spinachia]